MNSPQDGFATCETSPRPVWGSVWTVPGTSLTVPMTGVGPMRVLHTPSRSVLDHTAQSSPGPVHTSVSRVDQPQDHLTPRDHSLNQSSPVDLLSGPSGITVVGTSADPCEPSPRDGFATCEKSQGSVSRLDGPRTGRVWTSPGPLWTVSGTSLNSPHQPWTSVGRGPV